jgi:D-alanyl-D-alanine dipeptidase
VRRAAGVAALAALLLAPAVADGGYRGTRLVDVLRLDRDILLDVRYATPDNFTGSRLPGYCEQRALLLPRPARALARAQARLERDGYGLKVYDAYRPARASRAMVRWARRTGNEHLLNGYIASRSRHNLGAAVDLTLVRLSTGRQLDMGTRYDAFTTRSHTLNARGRVLRNRLRLRDAMSSAGWTNYRREWWHYDFPAPRARRLDVTIGC